METAKNILRPSQQLGLWLEHQAAVLKPGSKLPTQGMLSRTFMVSIQTVRAALKPFSVAGKIIQIQGKGTFIAPLEGANGTPGTTMPHDAIEKLAGEVSRLISRGELRRGNQLPSVKYLCRRFKVSATTVKNAYALLEKERLITQIGRNYWIGSLEKLIWAHPRKTIWLLLHNHKNYGDLIKHAEFPAIYSALERELSHHGFVLACEVADAIGRLKKQWAQKPSEPAGITVQSGNDVDFVREKFLPVLKDYRKTGNNLFPIVIDSGRPGDGIAGPLVHRLSRGNVSTIMARTLARSITEKGFENVLLFLNHTRTYNWQTHSYLNCMWTFVKIRTELKHLQPDLSVSLVVKPPQADMSKEAYLATQSAMSTPQAIAGIIGKYSTSQTYQNMVTDIRLANDFTGIFIKNHANAIWIFSSDADAASALDWAEKHRISIPDKVSVVTMENDPAFFGSGLAYCVPDFEHMGYVLAHALIGDIALEKSSKGFLHTRTLVVERMTMRNSCWQAR